MPFVTACTALVDPRAGGVDTATSVEVDTDLAGGSSSTRLIEKGPTLLVHRAAIAAVVYPAPWTRWPWESHQFDGPEVVVDGVPAQPRHPGTCAANRTIVIQHRLSGELLHGGGNQSVRTVQKIRPDLEIGVL